MSSTYNTAFATVLTALVVASAVLAVVPAPATAASNPHATFNFSPSAPNSGEPVTLDGSSSYASNGSLTEHQWQITTASGSVTTVYGPQVNYTWSAAGDYQVTLTVTDSNGNSDSVQRTISVLPEEIDSSQNNPLIESGDGPFRLLTNNDLRPNGTADHDNIYSIPSALIQQREVAGGPPLLRIDNRTLTLYQMAQYGMLTDSYRENLYNPVRLSTNSSWTDFKDVNVVDTHFLGFTANESHGQWTNESRLIWAKTESEPGWRRVRNAKVFRKSTDSEHSLGELYIKNKAEAEIYDGDPINYTAFNRQVVKETFIDTGPSKSQVVMADGDPRYRLENATVSGYWQGDKTVIMDHYASIARITEGAVYDDFWLVNPSGINVTVLNDYRVKTPSNYESTSQCTYVENNETKTGNTTKFETWTRINQDSTIRLNHGGTYYQSDGFIFHINNPRETKLTPYSQASITFKHTYGKESTCPNSGWSTTETVTVSNTYNSTSQNIKPVTAKDLNITVYIADKGYEKNLYFQVQGNQHPSVNPLETIEFTASGPRVDNKRVILQTPWIFIPQSLYDRVEMRQQGYNEWKYPSTHANAPLHYLQRDYLDGTSYTYSGQSNIRITSDKRVQSQVFEGVSVSPYVNDTYGNIELYKTIGGKVMKVPGDRKLNNPTAYATDIFGNRWEVDVVRRQYSETDVTISTNDGVIHGQLTDGNGTGVPGRTIQLYGAKNSSVTTGPNGQFTAYVAADAGITTMEFNGDPLQSNRETYYEAVKASVTTPTNMANMIGTPIGYVSAMISNLMLFVEWILLGLFITWWIKYRDQQARSG